MAKYRVEGTSARAPEYHPDGQYVQTVTHTGRTASKPRSRSASVRRKRASAKNMTAGFVAFLAVMICITMAACIKYLNLKEIITTQTNQNEKLASELSTLKSENDALLENVTNSIDWEYIRDTAINELGMNYATEDQIMWYNTDGNRYIRQYEEVPSSRK